MVCQHVLCEVMYIVVTLSFNIMALFALFSQTVTVYLSSQCSPIFFFFQLCYYKLFITYLYTL